MATKIDFKTLLMKLVNVFPKDMYLVHNWCAIAGKDSNDENMGTYICILDADVRALLDGLFPNKPILYVPSVREAKTDISKVDEVLNNITIKSIEKQIENITNIFNEITTWDTFNFNNDEIISLFDNAESLSLFENDTDREPVIISKSIFPLISEKTINDVKYAYRKYDTDDTLNQLILDYGYDLFQLIMIYVYLKL